MFGIKKASGKVGNVRKDLGVSANDIVSKNFDIDDTDLDGEKVMMNLEKGQYFMMNEIGSRIWEIINENTPVQDIIATLLSEYEVDENTCRAEVLEFLGSLKNAELITIK